MMSRPLQNPQEPSPALIARIQEALRLQEDGRMAHAEKIFRELVKENPDTPDILHIAALFFVQVDKIPFALTLLKKFIGRKMHDPKALKLMGEALYKNGEYEDAHKYLEESLALDSDDPDANGFMGLTLHKMARLKAAENFYRRSLAKKDSAEVLNKFAEILLMTERHSEAENHLAMAVHRKNYDYDTLIRLGIAQKDKVAASLDTFIAAMQMDPARDEAKTCYAMTLSFGLAPSAITPLLCWVAEECLKSQKVNHNDLWHLWFLIVFRSPENSAPKTLLEAKDYAAFKEFFEQEHHRARLLTPFFITGVEKIMVCDTDLEDLLTRLRRYYLERTKTPDEKEIQFLSALSVQCFFNEFIFDETAEEQQALAALRTKIETGSSALHEWLIYSCYRPLLDLKNHQKLHGAPDVLRVHIQEPREDGKIKKNLKSFGSIGNDISRKVRDQYEEHPYPRWKTYNYLPAFVDTSIAPRFHKKGADVLVAGCGTGKNILIARNEYPHADITAVDLSTASLAYAVRKCREYGLKNITFLQGDILGLADLGQSFDYISCAGVLHHMESPGAGLKILAGLLRKDGVIKLGLYSEHARQEVIKARAIIAARAFPPTLEGIRMARRYIKSQNEQDFRFLKDTTDFYNTSSCRDLIFHVQEIRYTLPQIKTLLDSAGLAFQAFDIPSFRRARYMHMFPEGAHSDDLEKWDIFEQKNPSFFSGMYQFTARKKPP